MKWHPTPVLLPGKSHGRRRLVGCSPWGCEQSDTTEWLHIHLSLSFTGEGNGNPLQGSCLENPGKGEPGGLPSMGSHRVGHDWSDLAAAAAASDSEPTSFTRGRHTENYLLRPVLQHLMRHDWKSYKKNFFIVPKVSFFFTHLNALFQNVNFFSASIL